MVDKPLGKRPFGNREGDGRIILKLNSGRYIVTIGGGFSWHSIVSSGVNGTEPSGIVATVLV